MVSTFTPNIQLEEPARGDYVGTWDTPVNANMTLLDLIAGGQTTISGAAGSVVLAAAQFQCKTITFNSTLLANINVTFPTSFTKSYEIQNLCTGSSAFNIALLTTAAGGEYISCPPGEIIEVINDGVNLKYKNFGRIGSYWDYAGSSVPFWVSNGCLIPPYLPCDGTTFSSATYPVLANILGTTTLPDHRGRGRMALDGGTGRVSSAVAGFSPNTVGAGGGAQSHTLTLAQIPTGITSFGVNAISVISNRNDILVATGGAGAIGGGGVVFTPGLSLQSTGNNNISVTSTNTGGGAHNNMQPTLVGGITMIRAG